ncbi:MAG: hypothetical protein U0263_37675 [Polyangiaceae bacterium]
MGKIDDVCKEVVEKVGGAAACGVVDLGDGRLVGQHSSPQSSRFDDGFAALTRDLLRGPDVDRLLQLVRDGRGVSDAGGSSLQEVHVTSNQYLHFMKTLRGGKAAIVLVTRRSTNIGMGWAMLKAAIPSLDALAPEEP